MEHLDPIFLNQGAIFVYETNPDLVSEHSSRFAQFLKYFTVHTTFRYRLPAVLRRLGERRPVVGSRDDLADRPPSIIS